LKVGGIIAQKPKPLGFECDFELDTCGWTQPSDSGSNVEWSRVVAGNSFGPSIDKLVSQLFLFLYFSLLFWTFTL